MQEIIYDLKKFENFLRPLKYITIFGSARFDSENFYCKKAEELSRILSSKGFAIITGGGAGIMQAANLGAKNNISIGFNLGFLQEGNNSANIKFDFKTMSARKFALINYSSAFVVFPGGYGTFDELFEILTLNQIGVKKTKIFLFGNEFWKKFDNLVEGLIEAKTIDENRIYEITDDIDYIVNSIY